MTNPANILQAKRVQLWLAPVGEAMPTNLGAPGGNWVDVGYTNPESARFRVTPEFQPVMAHQTDFPVKILQVATAAGIDVDLLEWKGDNIISVFGGGSILEVAGPPLHYRYTPPSFGSRSEVAAILDVYDGSKLYRFLADRCFNQSEVELTLNKTPESRLPLRLSILDSQNTPTGWLLETNDASFA